MVRILPLATPKINANDRLLLRAEASSLKPSTMTLQWSVLEGPLDLSAEGVVLTSSASDRMLLAADALEEGAKYMFALQVGEIGLSLSCMIVE